MTYNDLERVVGTIISCCKATKSLKKCVSIPKRSYY
jgi:hypothetical protein